MRIPSVIELGAVRSMVRNKDPEILRPAGQSSFDKLKDDIVDDDPDLANALAPDELALLIAVCVLTGKVNCPDDDLLPHCAALAGLVGAVPGDKARQRIVLDCAIAYGCGWRRTLQNHQHMGLDGLWESAFHLLVLQIMDAIHVANDRIAAILRPFLQNPAEAQLMQDLSNDRWLTASALAFRLVKPLHPRPESIGKVFEISANGGAANAEDAPGKDFCSVRGLDFALAPLPAGSRYVFDVTAGVALAVANDRVLAAGTGQRFLIRAGDFGAVEVSFPVGPNLGRLLRLDCGSHADVKAAAGPVSLHQWECSCGSWDCPERHRLASWFPDAEIGMKDFVNSAINGRAFPLKPKSLIAGMYYSLLSREGWGGKPDPDCAALPRIRRVMMVRKTESVDPATHRPQPKEDLRENFLLISSVGNFRPVRVIRCDSCGTFLQWTAAKCDCGSAKPKGTPTAVWQPIGAFPLAGPEEPIDETLAQLQRWKKSIDAADEELGAGPKSPGKADRLANRHEEHLIYQTAVEALGKSDFECVANCIAYACLKGWVPKEEE